MTFVKKHRPVISATRRSPADLRRCGGLPCLDFVNTLDWRGGSEPVEYLYSYDDFLTWSELVGLLDRRQAESLGRSLGKQMRAETLARARAFREAAYRILIARLHRRAPDERDFTELNRVIAEARANAALRYERGAFAWAFPEPARDARLPLWLVALSLADLLTSEALGDVRMCGGPECGWLILDTSKNHARKWCSMKGCGNRAKARRHYAKTR